MFRRVLPLIVLIAACEKTDHDSIDKWLRTEKGPGKLRKAVEDESIDPDLTAHAAVNLIKPPLSKDGEVRAVMENMTEGRRAQVIDKMMPRLWDLARIENEKKLPSAPHLAGKDALVMLRGWADDKQRAQIDGYLVDWYAVASYEGRANGGQHSGATVVRMVGPPFAKRLIEVVNGVIAAPGQEKMKNVVGDELMLAIAATGSPDAVKKLIEISQLDRGDKTLGERAFSALFKAYVNPRELFPIQSSDALVPNLAGLVAVAKNDSISGNVSQDAIELIRVVGAPKCFEPLIGLVAVPHRVSKFKYVAASNALRCGGTKTIAQVVRALPPDGAYDKGELTDTVALEISKMSPRTQVLTELRTLLGDKSTVARWTAIEALALMKSVEDKPRIAALSGVKDRLVGYWGNAGEGKADPTLGQRAKEVAEGLK